MRGGGVGTIRLRGPGGMRRAPPPAITTRRICSMETRQRSDGYKASRKVRYAVVGLGHIAQAAVLPAFAHARSNSELVALVSDNPVKQRELGKKYQVPNHFVYHDYELCLRSGEIDAVHIALPNSLHREFAVRAAQAGVHVLCEKPLAVTEEEAEEIIGPAPKTASS